MHFVFVVDFVELLVLRVLVLHLPPLCHETYVVVFPSSDLWFLEVCSPQHCDRNRSRLTTTAQPSGRLPRREHSARLPRRGHSTTARLPRREPSEGLPAASLSPAVVGHLGLFQRLVYKLT